jgi:hypothetical protein
MAVDQRAPGLIEWIGFRRLHAMISAEAYRRIVVTAALAIVLAGCSIFGTHHTAQQQTYLDKVYALDLQYEIPQANLPGAWERAKDFVGKYSTLPIVHADENDIQTAEVAPDGLDIGYHIYNYSGGQPGMVRIVVHTITNDKAYGSNIAYRARRDAHILAYYICYGVIEPSLILK